MQCFHSTTLMRLHFSTLCTLLSLLQLSEIVTIITLHAAKKIQQCLFAPLETSREQAQAELLSLSPDGTKLKINAEALFPSQTLAAANEYRDSPGSLMASSTSARPALDWIYGYKALPTHSTPCLVSL